MTSLEAHVHFAAAALQAILSQPGAEDQTAQFLGTEANRIAQEAVRALPMDMRQALEAADGVAARQSDLVHHEHALLAAGLRRL